jgi:hypothetical protein
MYLSDMKDWMRIELQDSDPDARLYTDAELERAIYKATALMSRLLPKRTLTSITIDEDNVTNGYILDISDDISNVIRIERVYYPVEYSTVSNPVVTYIDGKLLFKPNVTLTDGESLMVEYLTAWTPPSEEEEADYPSHLDHTLIIGAVGEALLFKAEKCVNTAVADLTAIDNFADKINSLAIPTFTAVAPTAPTISSPTFSATYSFVEPTCDAIPAVDTPPIAATAVISAIEDLHITPIIGDTSSLATEFKNAIDLALATVASGKTFTNVSTAGSEVAANYANLAGKENDVAGSTYNMALVRIRLLEQIINLYQIEGYEFEHEATEYAAQVAAIINKYQVASQVEVAKANGYTAEVNLFRSQVEQNVAVVQLHSEAVKLYQAEANVFQAKASLYNATSSAYVGGMQQLTTKSDKILNIAGRYLASGQAKVNEFLTALGVKPEFNVVKSSIEQR